MDARSSCQEALLTKHIQFSRHNSSLRRLNSLIPIFLRCLNSKSPEIRHIKTTQASQQTTWASAQLSTHRTTPSWRTQHTWDCNIPSLSNIVCLCLSLSTIKALMQLRIRCVTKAIKITTAFHILEFRTNTCSLLISTQTLTPTTITSKWRK